MSEPFRYLESQTEDDVLVLTVKIEQLKDYETAMALSNEFSTAVAESGIAKVAVNLVMMVMYSGGSGGAFGGTPAVIRRRNRVPPKSARWSSPRCPSCRSS